MVSRWGSTDSEYVIFIEELGPWGMDWRALLQKFDEL